MAGTPIQFAKFTSTPHPTGWAHTYHAGGLFAVFALTKPDANDPSLNAAGKDIINNLEAEFFTLEDKTLESIGDALNEAVKDVPREITLDMCLAYNKDDILYVFLKGRGEISIKRADQLGTLLKQDELTQDLKRASGRLQPNDRILLATQSVGKTLSATDKAHILSGDDLDHSADLLAGHVKEERGDAAALLLRYQPDAVAADNFVVPPPLTGEEETQASSPEEEPKKEQDHEEAEIATDAEKPREQDEGADESIPEARTAKQRAPKLPPLRTFIKPRMLLLLAAIVIVVILGLTIKQSLQKKTTQQNSALFHQIYDPAQRAYDEGIGLENLNKSLAHDDFVKAKNKLGEATGKFKPGSSEDQQIAALAKKLDDKLSGSSNAHVVEAKEVTTGSDLLSAAKTHADALAIAKDGDSLYFLTGKKITKTDTSGKSAKDIITNDSDWTDASGLGVYTGNVYVLDHTAGVLKYVAGASGYGKSSYFTTKPDLSKAADLAIDGSVWIVTTDGQILKFTRGVSDNLKITGLTTPLTHPVRIVTNVDMQNVYVLDTASSAIVKFDKTGTFQQSYNAPVLNKATYMDIDEKNNAAYVLSDGKIYQLSLQ